MKPHRQTDHMLRAALLGMAADMVDDPGAHQRLLVDDLLRASTTHEAHPEDPDVIPAPTFHGESAPPVVPEPQALQGQAQDPGPVRGQSLPDRNPPVVTWD